MDEKTLTALKGSIAKWEAIMAGTEEDKGTENCPLCHMFHDNHRPTPSKAPCEGCPVMERTGKPMCSGTPYTKYDDITFDIGQYSDNPPVGLLEQQRQAAVAELEFLRSLLPEE